MRNTRQPNLGITSKAGWCLWFTQEVWGTPHLYPSATAGFNATTLRHYDRNLPGDASVVLWFESWGSYGSPAVYDNWGHVATWVPGRGILSSPVTFVGPGQQWFGSIDELVTAMNRYGGKTVYIGWSEDISNVRIVEEDEMPVPDADNYYWRYGQKLASQVRGRELTRGEFREHLVGKSDLQVVEILSDGPEADVVQNWQNVGRIAVADQWDKQIYALQEQLAQVKAALANEQAKPPKEVIKEVQVIVEKPIEVIKEVPTIDAETQENVKETLKTVKSVKGMLVNAIGWIKNKLGR